MYGGTFKQVQRPDDDEFYCVMIVEDTSGGNHPRTSAIAPGKGSFEDMTAKAHGILANKPYVTQVHVNHRGNFWHRVER